MGELNKNFDHKQVSTMEFIAEIIINIDNDNLQMNLLNILAKLEKF